MLIPIRCFTCGNLIGDKYEEFIKRVNEGETPKKVLDDMGIERYCCRRMLLTHIEAIDQILPYYVAIAEREKTHQNL
ncbi:MAG: DNA-directed RNA polymerase subunit N [Nitrososphaerales archaeon]